MNNSLKRVLLIFTLILSLVLGTCSVNAAQTLQINKTSASLLKGETLQLKTAGSSGRLTWKSSNPSVAIVSQSGKVTAKKSGSVSPMNGFGFKTNDSTKISASGAKF